jgi:uncharacterized protein YxeA
MKKILLPILTLLFTSCAITTEFYQVYKTNIDNGIINKNEIVFEDNNCKVYYNLWNARGDRFESSILHTNKVRGSEQSEPFLFYHLLRHSSDKR